MQSLLGGWRVSLHRTRADWPIVAAAWLITLLAAILLSAGPIYSSAASLAGLHRTLADTPVADANVEVSLYGTPAKVATADSRVQGDLQQTFAALGGSIVRDARISAALALPDQPTGGPPDLASLGYLDGLAAHATLVAGDWPAQAGSSGPMQVVVVDGVATALHLAVGDEVSLVVTRSFGTQATIPVRLSGIFSVDAATAPYWYGDQQLISGVDESGASHTYGPFLTTRANLLGTGVASVHMRWRAFPNLARLTVDGMSGLQGRLNALPARLTATTGATIGVETRLPTILGDAQRSLLVSRTGILLLMLQLAILAAYAIILTASLLVDHRRIETAMLRSRGAGPVQVALLALGEGIVIAVPAVLLAPLLAVAALDLLNVVGPLADAGLDIVPHVTLDAYVAAGAAGAVCVGLLVLPALFAARGFAVEEGDLSRQETRTFGQRMGLDIALLAVTGIALWQLRLYGAPLTRTVHGSLGLDPLLVAAPAIGLLAGGVLALRILPLLAQGIEAGVSRGRTLVTSLGSRQLARRPLRYTRSALLLMLAMSMGVFALSYAATWSTSQGDQAAYQSGADLRAVSGQAAGGLPPWALASAYTDVAGAANVSPVERISDGISFTAGSGDLLALDAGTAANIVLFRGDESATPLAALMRTLRAGRPEPQLATLPPGAAYVRIQSRLEITSVNRIEAFDSSGQPGPVDPATLQGVLMSASAVVRDAHGILYRVETDPVPVDGSAPAFVLPLEPTDERNAAAVSQAGGRLDGPVELAAVGVSIWLPQDILMNGGTVGVATVSAGDDATGPWTAVPLTSVAWSTRMARGRGVPADVPPDVARGTAIQLTGQGAQGIILGNGTRNPAAQLTFLPASVASPKSAVPVIANRAFLASTASAAGDTISVNVAGALRSVRISGVVDAFPTTDPARPLLVLDEPTLGLLRLGAEGGARTADEWWVAAPGGRIGPLAAALRGSPFDSTSVVTVLERASSLRTDPVALSIIGALTLGFVATGLFAVVGLTVSAAVSARQRRTEFALLRALGLSGRQLSGWLWLENGSLVLISLLAGTGLGLLMGWMVLPFVTVTQQAAAPVPSVVVQIPWDRILVLEIVSGAALGVAVIVIGGVLRQLGVGSILRMGED